MNQIEASRLKNLGNKTEAIVHDFLMSQEKIDVENDLDNAVFGVSIMTEYERQSCRNLFISMSFRGKFLNWKNLLVNKGEEKNNFNGIGPTYYPTDFGACCLFVPHLDFHGVQKNQSLDKTYFDLKADAQHGRRNGLQLLLNAQEFNYGHIPASDGVGFKVALHHHADKPMMQFSSQLINAGTETQINVNPTVIHTTDHALSRLKPEERGCYAKGEVNLTFLPYTSGYKYSMNNCIINEVIAYILWECRCIPAFASSWIEEQYSKEINSCFGKNLYCANDRMNSMSSRNLSMHNISMENPKKIGNITKPAPIKCRPACNEQENTIQMSSISYPHRRNFFYKKRFCHIASHILQTTCQDENKAYFLDTEQPGLCETLMHYRKHFDDNSTCKSWPNNFMEEDGNIPNKTLIDYLFKYGRTNLAFVRVMIQSPYVTKTKRDVAMTITNYVANTGGLLGLCLGFSFISGIEIFIWICCSCKEVWRHVSNSHS